MNHIDPSAPNTLQSGITNREMSVDEVALIERANEEKTLFPQTKDTNYQYMNYLESSSREKQRMTAKDVAEFKNEEMSDFIAETDNVSSLRDEGKYDVTADKEALDIKSLKRRVSGRYSNCPRPWKLELRVDVDGLRPGKKLSGDFYYSSGATTSYFGSFIVDAPNIYVSSSQVTIIGIAETSWSTAYKKLRVTIPRHNIFQPAANAYANWFTLTNKKGAEYTCLYESAHFRTLRIEEDREQDVTPFNTYNTAALPSGGTDRVLSVAKAYAEAGVQLQSTGASNIVPTDEAGANHKWNNAELHDAMEKHFTMWQNKPGWNVWLFHANAHEYGTGLLGIMYDQKDKQRQGCASFYQTIDSNSAADLRTQLYVNVHELGHCFNLFHSFHKEYMDPPVPNRPSALSWMNYPQYFPGGASAFWSSFAFEFDDIELTHLRHGFRNNIIMGGNPFGKGAAVEKDFSFMENIRDESGLQLSIQASHFVQLGTPIHVGVAVKNISNETKEVFKDIHPNNGLLQIALQKPDGKIIKYHPPIGHLVMPASTYLKPGEVLEETCYIGFDADEGQIFDIAGSYHLFATYYCPDGSAINSRTTRINVRAPQTMDDERMAELMLGDEQGMLFFLEGSDSEFLAKGNDAFEEMKDRFTDHAMTNYVRVIDGLKASRSFVQIDAENKIQVKKEDVTTSKKLLTSIVKKQPEQLGISPQLVSRAQKCLDSFDSKDKTMVKQDLKKTA
ncbi:MAG: hypothetical protein OEY19_09315 [Gammaproteobacteria bacterium]|nr:hypothetical protein [Gammaproteobacteria bacterium]